MNNSDTAIRVEGLGKMYRIGREASHAATLQGKIKDSILSPFQWLSGQIREPTEKEVLWALKDLSFEIKQGEVVGFIGHNGAGKSTLLKLLSRITEPTTGYADIHGRIAALLEVGTGMHPELTGRENIYMNGTVLGMKKNEIDAKFEEIVEFSDISRFLDTPVKRYSSGMRVRLGFSIAAHLEPEILVIDEVLSVGDAAFQAKCLGKMHDVASVGRTVLFVSHQMDMIRALCDRCMLMSQGRILLDGKAEDVIDSYNGLFTNQNNSPSFEIDEDNTLPIQILSGRVMGEKNKTKDKFDVFESITIEFMYVVHKFKEGLMVNFELKRNHSTLFFSFDTDKELKNLKFRDLGKYVSRVTLPCPLLKPGHYTVTPGTGIANSKKIQHLEDIIGFDVELISQSSSLASYAEKRPGMIAVPLYWYTNMEQL